MGVVGTVIGTLGMAFMQGRAQQQQYEAQARAAEANAAIQQQNAEIMAQNSEKARQNAEETARVNAMNAEQERRRKQLIIGKQTAAGGASGLTNSGSLANALADSQEAIDYDTMVGLWNGRQNVDKIFGQSTDFSNQSSQYKYAADVERQNASNYRAAGKRAFMTSMLSGAVSAGLGAWGAGSGSAAASGSSGASWNMSTGQWALDSAHMTIGNPTYTNWWSKSLAYKSLR